MKLFNYLEVSLICLVLTTTVNAQRVGINTDLPKATLDILSQGNSAQTKNIQITNSDSINLLSLQDNGYLGLGTTNPAVRLDLRGNLMGQNIIGIGDSNLSASAAQAGALKYESKTTHLQYSDGNQWLVLDAQTIRDCVIADNSYSLVKCINNETTKLGNWNTVYDSTDGAFDYSTGVFTAKKRGLYTATFTVHFAIQLINAGSYVEGQWIASNGGTIKCTNSFPIGGYFMAYITCSGTLFLDVGDTLIPQIFQNTGKDNHLRIYGDSSTPRSDINFNNLSIIIE